MFFLKFLPDFISSIHFVSHFSNNAFAAPVSASYGRVLYKTRINKSPYTNACNARLTIAGENLKPGLSSIPALREITGI